MSAIDPFAPPKSAVDDIVVGKPRVPTTFKAMLVAFLVLDMAGNLISGSAGGIAAVAFAGVLAWRTFQGGYAASRWLGVILTIGIVGNAITAARMIGVRNTAGGVISLVVVAYLLALVGYLFLHPDMKAVFAKAQRDKWRGG